MFTNIYSEQQLENKIAVNFFPILLIVLYMFIPQFFNVLLLWRKSSYIHYEFTKLAKEYNPKINKVIIKNVNKVIAYRNQFTNNIVISSKIVDMLNCEEVKGILYHEILHKGKSYGLIKRVIVGFLTLPLIIFLSFLLWFFTSLFLVILYLVLGIKSIVFIASMFAATILLFEKTLWKSEHEADLLAAKKVRVEIYKSMLRKLVPKEKRNWNWHSHPSIEQRIQYLEYNKALIIEKIT